MADVLDDVPETQSFRLRLRRRFGEFSNRIRSWLGVPLAVGHPMLGLMALDHTERGYYSSRDVGLMSDLCKEMGGLYLRPEDLKADSITTVVRSRLSYRR